MAKMEEKKKNGRPSHFSAKLAATICWKVATGMTIVEIAAEDDMPAERTIYQWLNKHESFAQDYAQARIQQNDRHQDEMIHLENAVLAGAIDADAFNAVARQRNWRSERMQPKKWGKQIALNHSGEVSLTNLFQQAREQEGGNGGGD